MSDVAVNEREQIRYGNLREPKMPGLGRLSFGASVFLVLAAVILMMLCLVNVFAGLVWAVVALALAAPTAFPTKDGYGRYEVMWRSRKEKAARRAGKTQLRQGLLGVVPDGSCRLPGLAASTTLTSESDMHGRPFGLLHWPHSDLYSVVLSTSPAGFAGLDKTVRDNQVAHWAAWLGSLNTIEEIAGAAVVIETIPDSGQRLERAMERGRAQDESVPEFAAAVEQQIRDTYRVGSPTLTCRVTLTLTARVEEADSDGSKTWVRSKAEMAEQIGDLLPSWTGSLAATGAGTAVRPCTAQEIVDLTRVAFDPSVAEDVEEAQLAAAAGEGEGTGLVWSDAGPIYHEVLPDLYVHESAQSRTWQMKHPPRGAFFDTTLQRLLEPHKDIARKRVAILFRPESPESSANAADADVRKATFKATQNQRVKAVASAELRAAEKVAEQEAMGSPLVRVGVVVTVSTFSDDALRKASRAVKSGLAAQARIGLRVPRGSQDMAFLTGLPLGVVPQVVGRVPRKAKDDVDAGRKGRARRGEGQ